MKVSGALKRTDSIDSLCAPPVDFVLSVIDLGVMPLVAQVKLVALLAASPDVLIYSSSIIFCPSGSKP